MVQLNPPRDFAGRGTIPDWIRGGGGASPKARNSSAERTGTSRRPLHRLRRSPSPSKLGED
jgi:hypothetical protein